MTAAPTELLPDSIDRATWLAARRRGVGGSDAAAVCGLDRWKSAYEVYLDKIGDAPKRPVSDAMDWGNRLEPVIVDWFTEKTGLPVTKAGLMAHPEHPWMLGTVDRLVGDDEILECKNTSVYRAKEWADDQVPDGAELQTQHYLAVTGRKRAHVAVLIGGNQPEMRVVERDDDLIATLIGLEATFWQHVLDHRPPPVDGSEACADLLGRLWTPNPDSTRVLSLDAIRALTELPDAKAAAKAATARVVELENQVKAELADAEFGVMPGPGGDTVTAVTWKATTSRRIDAKALRAAHPDIAEAHTTTTVSRRFNPKDI